MAASTNRRLFLCISNGLILSLGDHNLPNQPHVALVRLKSSDRAPHPPPPLPKKYQEILKVAEI